MASETLVTIREAARRLGVTVRTVYTLASRGQFPPLLKIGRATRIRESDLDSYIEAGCQVVTPR